MQSILTCGNYKPWSVKRSLFLIGKYWIWPTKNSHLSELAGSVRTRWKKPEVSSSASHWWRRFHCTTATPMEDPLEKEMATHSSILTWEIPWTEKPDGLQSIALQRVRYDWLSVHTCPIKIKNVHFLVQYFISIQVDTYGLSHSLSWLYSLVYEYTTNSVSTSGGLQGVC